MTIIGSGCIVLLNTLLLSQNHKVVALDVVLDKIQQPYNKFFSVLIDWRKI